MSSLSTCILINSYLNTPDKIEAAHQTIEFLADKGYPIYFIGNYPIPLEIQQKVNKCLFTDNNPSSARRVIGWKAYTNSQSTLIPELGLEEGKTLFRKSIHHEHGLAHFTQMYEGFKLAQSFGHNHVISLSYDLLLSDSEFSYLESEIEKSPNLVVDYSLDPGISYEANIFTFLVDDFISIIDQKLHLFDTNPQGVKDIRPDWIVENYFKWMVDSSGFNFKEIPTIGTTICDANQVMWEWGDLEVTYHEPKNFLILGVNPTPDFPPLPLDIKSLEFQVNGNKVIATRSSNNINFYIPYVEGDYYYNDKFVFNSLFFKNTTHTYTT